jgi:hypothetical protein
MKSPEIERALEQFAQRTFGRSRQASGCVTCGSEKTKEADFRDALSVKEYSISKMCQVCQDDVFGGEE